MRKTVSAAAAATLVVAGGLAAAPAAWAADATVSVLHAIPASAVPDAAVVDVYANGTLLIADVKPGDLKTLTVPAGTYDLAVSKDGSPADQALLTADDVEVPAGANATVAAHLNVAGTDPAAQLSVFVNDTSTIAAGEGRVTVRHIADAPEVTITADGAALGNITNAAGKQELKADVPAKTYAVAVVPAAGGEAVFSTDLPAAEGANTIVYAWGSLSGGSFAVATQTVDGLGSAPAGVPAGEAGLAAEPGTAPGWLLALILLGIGGVALSTRALLAER